MHMRNLFNAILFILYLNSSAYAFKNGMVVSEDKLASEAGIKILEQGVTL